MTTLELTLTKCFNFKEFIECFKEFTKQPESSNDDELMDFFAHYSYAVHLASKLGLAQITNGFAHLDEVMEKKKLSEDQKEHFRLKAQPFKEIVDKYYKMVVDHPIPFTLHTVEGND